MVGTLASTRSEVEPSTIALCATRTRAGPSLANLDDARETDHHPHAESQILAISNTWGEGEFLGMATVTGRGGVHAMLRVEKH